MQCALGVAALALVPVVVSEQPPAAGRATRQALMLNLKRFDQGTLRRALDLALAKLALPGCSQVYADFELPKGGTPRDELDRMGIGPEEFLETLVFTDGSREPVCRMGQAVLAMNPGTPLVFMCPRFADFQIANPMTSASLIIHESLHALGLGENPPTSREITERVERRCWKPERAPKVGPSFQEVPAVGRGGVGDEAPEAGPFRSADDRHP